VALVGDVDGKVRSAERLTVIRSRSKRGGVLRRPVRARWGWLSTGTKAWATPVPVSASPLLPGLVAHALVPAACWARV